MPSLSLIDGTLVKQSTRFTVTFQDADYGSTVYTELLDSRSKYNFKHYG